MDFGQQRGSRVLKPIAGADAVRFDMEFERAIEVRQLRESRFVVYRWWRQMIGGRDVAEQLQQIPVERGGECEVPKPDQGRGAKVRRIALQQVCERLLIQEVIHQF
jgi:hypothetical protein